MQIRLNYFAPRLKRMRKPHRNSKIDHAKVVEFNSRQTMRCKETRARKTSDIDVPDARLATTTALIERARKTPPSIELSAYLAVKHGRASDIENLIDRVHEEIKRSAKTESWQYNDPNRDKLRLLASLVVEEWLSPAKFWRDSGNPYIASFASAMRCDRKTYRTTWQQYFVAYQNYPDSWYRSGKFIVEGK